MANTFTVRQPGGTEVHLRERTWISHILFRHPNMRQYLEAIKITIARPDRTYENTDFRNGMSYWRRGLGRGKHRNLWLAVVVNYKQSRVTRAWYGEVVTAYFAAEPPPDHLRTYDES